MAPRIDCLPTGTIRDGGTSVTLSERLAFYIDNYDLIGGGTYGRGPKKKIGNPTNLVCRFCGRRNGETTFRSAAHAIPEFLGNKQLFLLDECDECNNSFSRTLEDHLDKFTKPFRTLAQIKGKTKIPSYKSRDKKSRIDFENGLKLKSPVDNSFIQQDEKENKFIINIDTEPYVPAAVYKAIVKIALSTIEDPNELAAFEKTISWIRDPDHSKMMISPLNVLTTFVPGPNPNVVTTTMLYRKKTSGNIPYSIFLLAFGNLVYQIMVPSHLDAANGETLVFEIPRFPLPFERDDWSYGPLQHGLVDLSEHKRVSKSIPIAMHYSHKTEILDKSRI